MKTLKLTCIILLLAVAGYAQVITQTQISHLKAQGWQPKSEFVTLQQNRQLVADETELVMLKSSFKIETCNEAIFRAIQKEFTVLGFRYTATVKSDRKGLYTLYSVPFKMDELDRVKSFMQKLK